MVPIFVINLDKSKARMEHMAEALNAQNLSFTRIPAVDGRDLAEDMFRSIVDQARSVTNFIRPELGCFLSHRLAWEKAAEQSSEWSLVLEDDMFLADDFAHFATSLDWLPHEEGIVRLETSTNRAFLKTMKTVGKRQLCKVNSTTYCAGAYLIHRECARKLAKVGPADWHTADGFLFCMEESRIARSINIFQIIPAPAVQAANAGNKMHEKFASNIDEWNQRDNKIKRPFFEGLMLKIRKALLNYKRIPFEK
jgi:glycosyl transferase, family 25